MILVTLGTDEHPFERALDLVEPLRPTEELVVQHGHTPARSWEDVQWLEFVPVETLSDLMREADAVVCHAGVGTIMSILALGKRPIVIPRLATRSEHVDDHQLQIVRELGPNGLLVPLLDGDDIVAAVGEARGAAVTWQRDARLVRAVVAAVDGA